VALLRPSKSHTIASRRILGCLSQQESHKQEAKGAAVGELENGLCPRVLVDE
jgi:hypothetical protein